MIWSKSNVLGNNCQHQQKVNIFECQANQTTLPSTPHRVKKMDYIMIWSKSNVSGNNCQHQWNVKIF